MTDVHFKFAGMGIGEQLKVGRLAVPPNQRSYAWEQRHIRNLFEDLHEAITSGRDEHFLGTIVLVQAGRETPSIADGQQRVATASIMLARIRDQLFHLNREKSARSIDGDFLRSIDRDTEALVPRIKLNLEDNEFFSRRVLAAPWDTRL